MPLAGRVSSFDPLQANPGTVPISYLRRRERKSQTYEINKRIQETVISASDLVRFRKI